MNAITTHILILLAAAHTIAGTALQRAQAHTHVCTYGIVRHAVDELDMQNTVAAAMGPPTHDFAADTRAGGGIAVDDCVGAAVTGADAREDEVDLR